VVVCGVEFGDEGGTAVGKLVESAADDQEIESRSQELTACLLAALLNRVDAVERYGWFQCFNK
jgi:hypothetical protein